jgi:hypothetical protein
MSHELFMAILAMDSYNRTYFPGIKDSGEPTGMSGTQLGTATLLEIGLPAGYVDASVFAQAYTLANGQTVIAYRGTDVMSPDLPA